MKKILCIVLAGLFIISMTACQPNNQGDTGASPSPEATVAPGATNAPDANVTYKDGTYDGAGDAWDYGMENATVVVDDSKIVSITLRRLDKDGKEVNYDLFAGQTTDGKVYPNLKQFRTDMAEQMIDRQTYDVDTISGATTSTKNWKLAVQRALEKAR